MQSELVNLIKLAPLMLYGLFGVFARPIMDFFGLYLRNRKLVVQTSVALEKKKVKKDKIVKENKKVKKEKIESDRSHVVL